MYFMLAILSKNKTYARFMYSGHAHLFSELNMLTWSGQRSRTNTKEGLRLEE